MNDGVEELQSLAEPRNPKGLDGRVCGGSASRLVIPPW